MKFEWKEKPGRYSSGKNLVVNEVVLGSTHWLAGTDQKGSKIPPWGVNTNLPGYTLSGRYETEKEAEDYVEDFTKRWFKRMNK